MAIYLVTPFQENLAALEQQAQELGYATFRLQNNAGFFVQAPLPAVELSHALGITKEDKTAGPNGLALVTAVTSYYGRGIGTMWDWLKVKMEQG
jgi:hypothetical protein